MLAKMKEEDKVILCRKYFYGGFLLLPWLWFVNAVWFFPEAKKANANPQIRKYVIWSFIGALICAIGLGVWASTFQNVRASWGATGDALSVVIMKGVP